MIPNCKKIENRIKKLENKSILIAYTDDVGSSLGVVNTPVGLNLNNVLLQKGSDLCIEDGAIKCLKDGIVFIQGSIRFYNGEKASGKVVTSIITDDMNLGYFEGNIPYLTEYTTTKVSGYINVTKGDLIRLKATSNDANVAIQAWQATTNLSVEYI